jgi:hypothetical protein
MTRYTDINAAILDASPENIEGVAQTLLRHSDNMTRHAAEAEGFGLHLVAGEAREVAAIFSALAAMITGRELVTTEKETT